MCIRDSRAPHGAARAPLAAAACAAGRRHPVHARELAGDHGAPPDGHQDDPRDHRERLGRDAQPWAVPQR
eukprot:357533-Alexandrium_andersonii.AAC.1